MTENVIPWPGSGRDSGASGGDAPAPGTGWLLELAEQAPPDLRPGLLRLAAAAASRSEGAADGGGRAEPDAGGRASRDAEGDPHPADGGAAPEGPTPERLQEAWRAAAWARARLHERPPSSRDRLRRRHEALDRALLRCAGADLEAAVRDHRRLLEDASHDIRSPLNSILFLADALRSGQSGNLNPVQRRQIDVLYTAAVSLVKLVNDLIDFARLGSRDNIAVGRSSFSLESVLADVRALMGPLLTHREIELDTRVETEGLRTGDPQLLSRVLLNLVANAVQALDPGGHVWVHVSDSDQGDLRIEVGDDGPGADEEALRERLAAGDRPRGPGETRGWTRGLGLTIAARLVAAADGRIRVEGPPEGGTSFTVVLPFPRL